MTKNILKLAQRYLKAKKDLEEGNFSQIDIRYSWAQDNLFTVAEQLAEAVCKHLKKELQK